VEPADRISELQNHISVLENGSADLHTLQKIALVCVENPVEDFSLSPLSHGLNFGVDPLPPIGGSRQIKSLGTDIWMDGKSFDRLFTSLVRFLDPSKVGVSSKFSSAMTILKMRIIGGRSLRVWFDSASGDARKSSSISRGSRK
jgi:hypothetical protein